MDSDVASERNRLHKLVSTELQSVVSSSPDRGKGMTAGRMSSPNVKSSPRNSSVTGRNRTETIKTLGAQMEQLI